MRVWVQFWAPLVACLLLGAAPSSAAGRSVQVCVQDQRGLPIVGAQVQVQGDATPAGVSDGGGCATGNVETKTMVESTRGGFSRAVRALGVEKRLVGVMQGAGGLGEGQGPAARSPPPLRASA